MKICVICENLDLIQRGSQQCCGAQRLLCGVNGAWKLGRRANDVATQIAIDSRECCGRDGTCPRDTLWHSESDIFQLNNFSRIKSTSEPIHLEIQALVLVYFINYARVDFEHASEYPLRGKHFQKVRISWKTYKSGLARDWIEEFSQLSLNLHTI